MLEKALKLISREKQSSRYVQLCYNKLIKLRRREKKYLIEQNVVTIQEHGHQVIWSVPTYEMLSAAIHTIIPVLLSGAQG